MTKDKKLRKEEVANFTVLSILITLIATLWILISVDNFELAMKIALWFYLFCSSIIIIAASCLKYKAEKEHSTDDSNE